MRTLYPEIAPYRTHRLAVDALHTLHVEECGNPDGIPVIFLHGGPGAGLSPVHRRFFDPARYRIVLFDQRGTGQSTPFGELRDNTTAHLIADIEAVRALAGIERWLVFGGSWGSTLALAYAQAHPARATGVIVRGVYLGREEENRWFNEADGGARWVFPERWARYEAHIPAGERGTMIEAYWRRMDDPDAAIAMAAAQAWLGWAGKTVRPRCCTSRMPRRTKIPPGSWPRRGSRRITSATTPFSRTDCCCATSTAYATCRA